MLNGQQKKNRETSTIIGQKIEDNKDDTGGVKQKEEIGGGIQDVKKKSLWLL